MPSAGLVWECECGSIGYGENPPKECKECSSIGTFSHVPEDLVVKKEEESILSQKPNSEEDEEDEEEDDD